MLTNMVTLLEVAEKRRCAIPAFNVYNQETVLGVLQAAEEENSCVILQMYSRLFDSIEAEFLSPSIVAAAHRAKVKVAFHLDHGAGNAPVIKAIRYGCTSVMRDASAHPYEQNVAITKWAVDFAHAVGVSVEGELGHIGLAKDGPSKDYTSVEMAKQFADETGVDALAIQVGTAHGHYEQAPTLAIDRIREIHAHTKAHLVLHGGSGIPDDQIADSINAGIRKINFGTDVCCTFLDGVRATDASIFAVDLFMKRPTQLVKEFSSSKIRLLKAQNSNED